MRTSAVLSSDIYRYNTKFTLQGDEIIMKRYSVHSIKGYKVKGRKKQGELKKRFNPNFDASKHATVEELKEDMMMPPPIDFHEYAKREEHKKENFKKSVRRANKKIYELVACNNDKWTLDDKKHTVKFNTLTFKGDMTDVKQSNKELTSYIKRLSYYHTGRNKNELKYIAIPELQKRGSWHYHIIFFNLPYTPWVDLVKIWGLGTVGIEAVKKSSSGQIAKYVTKYLSKSYEIKEDGKIDRDLEKEKDLADYDNYKALGLENMKRYSTSRGLKKATNIFIDLNDAEYEYIINLLHETGKNKSMGKDEEKKDIYIKTFLYSNEFRGDVIEMIIRKSREIIYGVRSFLFNVSSLKRYRKHEAIKFLEYEDFSRLKKMAFNRDILDKIEALEYNNVIAKVC